MKNLWPQVYYLMVTKYVICYLNVEMFLYPNSREEQV